MAEEQASKKSKSVLLMCCKIEGQKLQRETLLLKENCAFLNLADRNRWKKSNLTDFNSGNQWFHNYVRRMFNNSKILPMRRFFSLILMVVFLIVIALSCSKSNGDSGGGSGTGGRGGSSNAVFWNCRYFIYGSEEYHGNALCSFRLPCGQ
jgi:hypothetical protein